MTYKTATITIFVFIAFIILTLIISISANTDATNKLQSDNQQRVVQLVADGVDPIIANCTVYGFGHGGAKERYDICLKALETRGLNNGKETRE